MTVRELIEELQEAPQDVEVSVLGMEPSVEWRLEDGRIYLVDIRGEALQ